MRRTRPKSQEFVQHAQKLPGIIVFSLWIKVNPLVQYAQRDNWNI